MSDIQPEQGGWTSSSPEIRRQYVRVIVIWVVVLAALYAFQAYFN